MIKFYFIIVVILLLICGIHLNAALGCTVIVVGKKASTDGSVILSQTDCGENCRIQVVHGKEYSASEQAPIHWGIQDVRRPLDGFGEVIYLEPGGRATLPAPAHS